MAQSLTSGSSTVDDYDGDIAAYVNDLVSDWLNSAELPAWWNGHDTDLLRERVHKYAS